MSNACPIGHARETDSVVMIPDRPRRPERPAFIHARMLGAVPDGPFPVPNHTEEKGSMKMWGLLLTAHKADWVCLHVGRRPVILYLRRDGPVPVAGVVIDHVLFVERLLPVQNVRHARPV
jgi:hypothetical protein